MASLWLVSMGTATKDFLSVSNQVCPAGGAAVEDIFREAWRVSTRECVELRPEGYLGV